MEKELPTSWLGRARMRMRIFHWTVTEHFWLGSTFATQSENENKTPTPLLIHWQPLSLRLTVLCCDVLWWCAWERNSTGSINFYAGLLGEGSLHGESKQLNIQACSSIKACLLLTKNRIAYLDALKISFQEWSRKSHYSDHSTQLSKKSHFKWDSQSRFLFTSCLRRISETLEMEPPSFHAFRPVLMVTTICPVWYAPPLV